MSAAKAKRRICQEWTCESVIPAESHPSQVICVSCEAANQERLQAMSPALDPGLVRESERGITSVCPNCVGAYGSDGCANVDCPMCKGEGVIRFEVIERVHRSAP